MLNFIAKYLPVLLAALAMVFLMEVGIRRNLEEADRIRASRTLRKERGTEARFRIIVGVASGLAMIGLTFFLFSFFSNNP